MGFGTAPAASNQVRLADMSSDITSRAPEKKTLSSSSRPKATKRRKKKAVEPVWITSQAFDEALDAAETEWLTIKEFADDPRFGRKRHPSGLQHAVGANRCGLKQSRRSITVRVPCRGGYTRERISYRYALWRIEELLGFKVIRRPVPGPPPTPGPLERSVQFTSPTPQEEGASAPPIPHPRLARDPIFIRPPARPELEACGAGS